VFSQDLIHRDNSDYLKHIAEHASKAIVFTRPMQLGKTTLFSLAEELFSKNKVAPNCPLRYMPVDKDKNKWFVLYLDFGSVSCGGSDDWQVLGKELDEEARGVISRAVHRLLRENTDLNKEFEHVDATSIKDQTTSNLIRNLASAIGILKVSLLILVDEYDQPVREALLRFAPRHSRGL
jgi:hypothetical protein